MKTGIAAKKVRNRSEELNLRINGFNTKENRDISCGNLENSARYNLKRVSRRWLACVGLCFLSVLLYPNVCLAAEIISAAPDAGLSVRQHEGQGIMLGDLEPGGPADLAGLKPKDIVLKFGDHNLLESNLPPLGLYGLIQGSPVDEPIALLIKRGARIFEATIFLKLNPRLGISFKGHDGPGVLVLAVGTQTLAEAVGIRKDDIILEYGGTAFRGTNNEPTALGVAIAESSLNAPIPIVLLRGSQELTKIIHYGTPGESIDVVPSEDSATIYPTLDVPGDDSAPIYSTLTALEDEAFARYLNCVIDLIDPLKAVLSAREELRALTAQEQTVWSLILAELDAADLDEFDLEEEARLRTQALPMLARAALEYDRTLMQALDRLQEMALATSSRPLRGDQMQAVLDVDVLMGQAKIHAFVESQAVLRLEAMHAPLLDRRPEWAGIRVPESQDPFGVLLLKIEEERVLAYAYQAQVDERRDAFSDANALLTMRIADLELKNADRQAAVVDQLEKRANAANANPAARELLIRLSETIGRRAWEAVNAAGELTDPMWLERDSIFYLPPVSGDEELSRLLKQRAKLIEDQVESLSVRQAVAVSLEPLQEARDAIFAEMAPDLSAEAFQIAQIQKWQTEIRSIREDIDWLASIIGDPKVEDSPDTLSPRQQAAALLLLCERIESMAGLETRLNATVLSLSDDWRVPLEDLQIVEQARKKRALLTRLGPVAQQINLRIEAIQQVENPLVELHLYMQRLNELRLKRLTSARAAATELARRSDQDRFFEMVSGWIEREWTECQEEIELARQVAQDRTDPFVDLQWRNRGRAWEAALVAGGGIVGMELQTMMLKDLPKALADIFGEMAPAESRLHQLIETADRLELLKGVAVTDDGLDLLLADETQAMQIGVRLPSPGEEVSRLKPLNSFFAFFSSPASAAPFPTSESPYIPHYEVFDLKGGPPKAATPAPAPAPAEMHYGRRFVAIGKAAARNSARNIRKNWVTYYVCGGFMVGGVIVSIVSPPAGAVMWTAGKAGGLGALVKHTTTSTAKTAIRALPLNPKEKQAFLRMVDTAQGTYEIAKFIDGANELRKSFTSLREAAKIAGKAKDFHQRNLNRMISKMSGNLGKAQADASKLMARRLSGVKVDSSAIQALERQIVGFKTQLGVLHKSLKNIDKLGPAARKALEAAKNFRIDATVEAGKDLALWLGGSKNSNGESVRKGLEDWAKAPGDLKLIYEFDQKRLAQFHKQSRIILTAASKASRSAHDTVRRLDTPDTHIAQMKQSARAAITGVQGLVEKAKTTQTTCSKLVTYEQMETKVENVLGMRDELEEIYHQQRKIADQADELRQQIDAAKKTEDTRPYLKKLDTLMKGSRKEGDRAVSIMENLDRLVDDIERDHEARQNTFNENRSIQGQLANSLKKLDEEEERIKTSKTRLQEQLEQVRVKIKQTRNGLSAVNAGTLIFNKNYAPSDAIRAEAAKIAPPTEEDLNRVSKKWDASLASLEPLRKEIETTRELAAKWIAESKKCKERSTEVPLSKAIAHRERAFELMEAIEIAMRRVLKPASKSPVTDLWAGKWVSHGTPSASGSTWNELEFRVVDAGTVEARLTTFIKKRSGDQTIRFTPATAKIRGRQVSFDTKSTSPTLDTAINNVAVMSENGKTLTVEMNGESIIKARKTTRMPIKNAVRVYTRAE
jgi:predicted  nucleic acid-binding Zn-ribbon protein